MVNATRMGGTPLIMCMKKAMFNRTVATVGLTALLWLLCTLTIPDPLQAAIFFDSDFETCNVGTGNDFPCEGWDDVGLEWFTAPTDNTLEITNTDRFTGSKSVKASFNAPMGDGTVKPSLYHNVPLTNHMFMRAALHRNAAFQTCAFNNSTKMIRFRGNNQGPGGGYPVVMIIQQSLGYRISVEGGYGMGSVVYPGGPTVGAAWEQVEMEVKFNTPGVADGIIRFWVNGTLYIERLNLQLRGPTPTSVNGQGIVNPSTYRFDTAQIYIQCGSGNIWYDRIAVGDTRIGPVQSTSASADSTPPARPTLNPIP